ncbi:c-type cytochrome [Neobacillus cucumis]|uniref:Cytochrome C551 n=1 Tax=Neobacillus cucumis TaxID=1740721 RepID=A0A2N5HSF7_9BACI|nr:cytochrome c [Neobacillus cucumis]PLS08448.1 cytochrome C551 [Neobacillus cucumis]
MKKIWVTLGANVILAGLLVFLLFFYEGPQKQATNTAQDKGTSSADKAEQIVSSNCVTCHGQNLQGGAGPNLTKIGSKYSQSEIENIINHGRNAMPSGVISPDQAKVVAEWLAQKK